jgi:hypothetical protein
VGFRKRHQRAPSEGGMFKAGEVQCSGTAVGRSSLGLRHRKERASAGRWSGGLLKSCKALAVRPTAEQSLLGWPRSTQQSGAARLSVPAAPCWRWRSPNPTAPAKLSRACDVVPL